MIHKKVSKHREQNRKYRNRSEQTQEIKGAVQINQLCTDELGFSTTGKPSGQTHQNKRIKDLNILKNTKLIKEDIGELPKLDQRKIFLLKNSKSRHYGKKIFINLTTQK